MTLGPQKKTPMSAAWCVLAICDVLAAATTRTRAPLTTRARCTCIRLRACWAFHATCLREDLVKVGAAIARWRPQTCQRILPALSVVEDDVAHLLRLERGRKVDVDLEEVVNVLGFQGLQQVLEPLKGLSRARAGPYRAQRRPSVGALAGYARFVRSALAINTHLGVAADPEKVDLAQLHDLARVDDAVPDGLEHRRERRDTNAGTDAHRDLEFGGPAQIHGGGGGAVAIVVLCVRRGQR